MNAFRAYFACAKISFKLPFLGVLVDQSEFVFVVSVVPLAFGIWHLAVSCHGNEMCARNICQILYCIDSCTPMWKWIFTCVRGFFLSFRKSKICTFWYKCAKKNNKSIYTAEITGLNTCSISIKRTIFFFSFIGSMDSIEFGKSQAIRLISLLMLCTA